jgi:hypothetical protein
MYLMYFRKLAMSPTTRLTGMDEERRVGVIERWGVG